MSGIRDLFQHNPPNNSKLIKNLFINRTWELEELKTQLDLEEPRKQIEIIHGNSRTGKSHLAFRYFADYDKTKLNFIKINAADGGTANLILLDMFSYLRNHLESITEPAILYPEEVSSLSILNQALRLIHEYEQLITGDAENVTLTESEFQQLEVNAKAMIPKLFSAVTGQKIQNSSAKTITLKRPDERRIIDIIKELAETLVITTDKPCLFYIDDMDLLEGTKKGSEQVKLLKRLLYKLADSKRITVSASVRTRYASISEKELVVLCKVGDLEVGDLKEVYNIHIEHLHNKQSIFDDKTVETISKFSRGLVGHFLWNCREFWTWGRRKRLTRLLTENDFKTFLNHKIDELHQDLNYREYMKQIIETIKEGKRQIQLDEEVLNTPLMFFVLEEPARWGEKGFAIRTLVSQIIKGKTE